MKVAARVLDVTSNLEGEHVGMTIDTGALAHIMSVLTDLYSDPELAIIREYSTNAFDAHVEAGIKRPIEVDVPTSLSPFVKIRDYGEGLDAEDIREIYSKYGASTKRNSDDVVGMLGLGCKSALTYTDQFTLSGIKNGIMTQVSVSRDEDGTGSMTIVYEGPTDEESGVEIQVPAKRYNTFKDKADDFFRFWPEGSVLVNGKKPERIGGVWIADDLLLTTETDQSYVVMGNVPYPMLDDASEQHTSYNKSYGRYETTHTVAFVKIGEVNFTPSRESLQTTSRTKATLSTIRERVKKEKNPAFERIIASAKSKEKALEAYHEVVNVGYDAHKPMWNGYEIPLVWKPEEVPAVDSSGNIRRDADGVTITTPGTFLTCPAIKRYRRRDTDHVRQVENNARTWGWIVNFDGAEMTPYKRLKLEQYQNKHKIELPQAWALVTKLPEFKHPDGTIETPADWFPKDHILDWNVINQEKIIREKVERSDGRPSGSYAGFVCGIQDTAILAANIDTSKPIFFEHGSTSKWWVGESKSVKALLALHKDATIIILSGNRIAKFKRDFPMAQESTSYLRAEATKWSKNLTEDDKLTLHLQDNGMLKSQLSSLKSIKDKLLDPKLVEAIDLAGKTNPTLVSAWRLWSGWGAAYQASFKNPLDKYILLTHLDRYARLNGKSQEHLNIYLNAAYAARTEETV